MNGAANLYDYKARYLEVNKRQSFYYCVFANYTLNTDGSRSGSSGLGELAGNDFMVLMGDSDYQTDTTSHTNWLICGQAITLMHEFGHNLGLKHGGDEDTNYKPNYRSIMNYMFSNVGLPVIGDAREGDRFYYHRYGSIDGFSSGSLYKQYFPNGTANLVNGPYTTTWLLDYSDGAGLDLDESAVDESKGLRRTNSQPVDFNGNGSGGDPVYSMNLNQPYDTVLTTLKDYNDWGAVDILFMRKTSGNNSIRASQMTGLPRPDYVLDDRQPLADCTGFHAPGQR